jgi:hypothetical protein
MSYGVIIIFVANVYIPGLFGWGRNDNSIILRLARDSSLPALPRRVLVVELDF